MVSAACDINPSQRPHALLSKPPAHLSHWLAILALVLAHRLHFVQGQDLYDFNQFDNSTVLPLISQIVYGRISNATAILSRDLSSHSGFCVKDPEADWNRAFNFSSDLSFLISCIRKTRGDITQRLCTAAEMKLYFKSLIEKSESENYLKPNKNCNFTSWISGCEPGWACSCGQSEDVDLLNPDIILARTHNCQPCCEGFFCPQGLTCMIPCPLGSYCPLATLDETTGVCEPYKYQLPPGKPNHTCGGANIWADLEASTEVFCPVGSYCPTTVKKIPCSSGNYCEMGSTSEKRCFKLTSCNQSTPNQNSYTYGIMLIAALCTLLLIVYNFSYQVLATRSRTLAKSREVEAKNARKISMSHERWKSATYAAKNFASGLSAHLSPKFTRKNDIPGAPLHPRAFSGSFSSPSPSKGKESTELVQMSDSEENPDSFEGFIFGPEDKIVGNVSRGKLTRTHSQIFKYAYTQLEKEKVLQRDYKDLTIPGEVKMTNNIETRKRPLIEVSFKNLTLTLKQQNKHILRCLTGKIKPGHITAVMGPSGAGKTTFISALAGKAIGCKMTGLILINGKNEAIHLYKKIIGFVPQDDVVHGNLTVEENLWFSAKCRLSADLSKADQFLVTERVIESLGLQTVRNSLVGTLEKRGISGGQRKRVNVGMEMVMEPSLLILDEPTSGLDSASSQLLLRALRREALQGVNICMVVHQPSYALFKMFDDLVLLAKGGLTVYHGSVEKVEEYFAGLGVNVPDRINPPDYYIDILERIVTTESSSSINSREFPVRWMLHKGYSVPPDMWLSTAGLASPSSTGGKSSDETNLVVTEMEEPPFAGSLWNYIKANVELHCDSIRLNILKSKDLSNRRTPGVLQQYKYFLCRVGKQRLREARIQAVDYLILLLAGACLGSLSKVRDHNLGTLGYTYTIIAVPLLCKIAALRSFSLDRLHYWREAASGMNSLAYFLAKDTIDHFNTVIKPLVYLSMFYFFTNPRSSLTDNYIVLLFLVYCVTGIGYALAIFFDQGAAQLLSVLLPVVLTLTATQPQDSEVLKILANLCYPKWTLEAFVIANAERYSGVWLITRCGILEKSGYDLHNWNLCITILIMTGLVSRVIAFFCMLIFQKK